MNRSILFATTNRGKQTEALEVANRYGAVLMTVDQFIEQRSQGAGDLVVPEVFESAPDYAGNARLKAEAFSIWSGLPALADDTGLEVAVLDGRPGVYSARYAGSQGDAAANIKKLLEVLRKEDRRQACFRCVLCLAAPGSKPWLVTGVLEGEIARERRGAGGFGYDSIFIVSGIGKTLAELKEGQLSIKTHRILALEKFFTIWRGTA